MWNDKKEQKNSEFHIPNSKFSGARWARLRKLRIVDCGMRIEKENQKIRNPQSAIRNAWADAFSAQRPCFRAISVPFRRKEKK
jgi:hypothetical protein